MAAFTGIGFDSTKFTWMNGSSHGCSRRAAAKSPFSASSMICTISAGAALDATEITPRPPIAITATVSGSSPLNRMKSSGTDA